MEITRKDLGNLVSEITLKLDTADYKPQFDKELKSYKNKAHLKGFRKGKTPISAIKKMYGKPLLAEVLNKEISENFDKYIKEQELDLLGEPIPLSELDGEALNVNSFEPLEVGFKVGLKPEFDVVGLGESAVYDLYEVDIAENLVNDELTNIRKRFGEQVSVERDVTGSDYVGLRAKELDEEGNVKEGGLESDFDVLIERITDDLQSSFIGKAIGSHCEVNILELEKNADRDFVTKYFLKVDSTAEFNTQFDIEIIGIKEMGLAELNQDFFDKAFGKDEVKSEADAQLKIKEELESYYNTQGKALSERYILESLVEQNDIDLPNEFLKEWLVASNENVGPEEVENEYEGFVKNLKWSLIKQEAGKKYKIEIAQEEIKESMIAKVKQMMMQYNYPGLDYESMAQTMLQKPDKVREEYEEVFSRKVFDEIMQSVTLKKEKIDIEDYKERVKNLQQ